MNYTEKELEKLKVIFKIKKIYYGNQIKYKVQFKEYFNIFGRLFQSWNTVYEPIGFIVYNEFSDALNYVGKDIETLQERGIKAKLIN